MTVRERRWALRSTRRNASSCRGVRGPSTPSRSKPQYPVTAVRAHSRRSAPDIILKSARPDTAARIGRSIQSCVFLSSWRLALSAWVSVDRSRLRPRLPQPGPAPAHRPPAICRRPEAACELPDEAVSNLPRSPDRRRDFPMENRTSPASGVPTINSSATFRAGSSRATR